MAQNPRYERKYRPDLMSLSSLHQFLKMHPASFSRVYSDRRVNNIYFDTPIFNAFYDNVDGISERKKYRLRWYGEEYEILRDPVFEIKIKKNLLGVKVIHTLPTFPCTDFPAVCRRLEQEGLKPPLFQPVLFNSYLRSYYLSFDGRFRITVDSDLSFGQFDRQRLFFNRKKTAVKVLELKYEVRYAAEAESLMQTLPFRLSKTSKYTIGLEAVMA